MSSSFEIPRRFPNVLFVLAALALAAPIVAQEPGQAANAGATRAVIALGESLFSDKRLSSTGSMSCASCHRLERSFTEDKPVAIGQRGVELGRNTPTLLGLTSVKAFPVGGSFAAPPKMVSLEERVVVPLRDLAEMNATVGDAIERLSKDPACVAAFNAAFEEPEAEREPVGVTGDRMAAALAAYIRSIKHHETPSLLALAGSNVTLDEPVSRGLGVFRDEGKCQTCHSGPGLTNGELHVVSRLRFPNPGRHKAKGVAAAPGVAGVSIAVESAGPDTRPNPEGPGNFRARRGGGYGESMPLERQTLTLLDLKRTGPYFRDGSAVTLSDALRQHVANLRDVGGQREDIFKNPSRLFSGRTVVAVSGHQMQPWSASAKEQLCSDVWIPANLTSDQIDDLVAFLTSLSPTD